MSVQSLFPRLSSPARVYALIMMAGLSLLSQSCGIMSDATDRALSRRAISPSEPTPASLTPKSAPQRHPSMIETGVASWYGPGFHGKTTASGEIFNEEKFTAAHPTLPWGSRVLVTNLANGKSVELRINDRGPFTKGRIIDVSRAAARELGMIQSGIAHVKVKWLSGFERSAELKSKKK